MKDFSRQYKKAQSKALICMKKGQISAYLQALKEMNKYKNMMIAVIAN